MKIKISKDQNTVTCTKRVTLQFVPDNSSGCLRCYFYKTRPETEWAFTNCSDTPCTSTGRKDGIEGYYKEVK